MSLDANLEHGKSMFRAMFNTAFVSDNVLKLEFDGMDVPWDRKDQYPKEFMAEIVFSQVDAATSLVMVDLSSEEKENRKEKSMRKIEPEKLPAEGKAVTSVSDSASSSAINNGSVEATAAVVSNLVQIPDLTLPKQEKIYQQDGSRSSTSMSSEYDYDVFLSFRGPDTRSGITNFLYTRLLGARIHTFKDDEELRVGEEFGPELLTAISQSKIAIPIFSKGYASSKWCLNQLVQMVQCSKKSRQKIMPIFYDVTPAEVGHQIGSYEEAFLLHEKNFGVIISKWKAALNHVANLNGWVNSKENRLCGKKVLLLLDDVDQMTHWDALIGKPARFSLGSRIIITSRNRDIIDVPEVCYPYELMSLDFNQSLQLFCKHAFWRDYPLDEYVAFSTEVVKSTGGLPLALEAIGKLLRHRSKDVWDVILKKLKQVPLSEVKRKLKISYDTLDDCQKHIFLEIACLFAGFDQRIVLHSWKDSNLFPKECLEVLQQISLIKISEDNKLWMHDQLRGLGTDIVRRECDKERKKKKDSVGEPSGRFGRVDGNEGNKKNSSSLSKI
ncbi:hypothetical protein EUGRSUZ_C01912 [Eucalyptus grandis]|uniref:Uncharacterized protein n=2 Tax=Eucalyptus grandis TaxID=71139 RepID=A0ACC3LE41_EUCGR|nr:hypothetical protein EUGRSUZ_C01912 [Eucalyptus grandis]